MDSLQAIKDRLPPYAKDVKLNLDAVLFRGSLAPDEALGAALAASIVGKCEFCVKSHYKLLRDAGMSAQQLRDVGRIAAVIAAVAHALANQHEDVVQPA